MESKETTTTPVVSTPAGPKTSTITLRGAGGATLMLLAVRRADNAVVTVTIREGNKKPERGMTSMHADMASARAHLAKLAKDAEKLGWKRGASAGFTARPDVFSKLPAPPKAGKEAK